MFILLDILDGELSNGGSTSLTSCSLGLGFYDLCRRRVQPQVTCYLNGKREQWRMKKKASCQPGARQVHFISDSCYCNRPLGSEEDMKLSRAFGKRKNFPRMPDRAMELGQKQQASGDCCYCWHRRRGDAIAAAVRHRLHLPTIRRLTSSLSRHPSRRKKQRKCGDMPLSMDAQLHVDLVPTSTPEASDGRRHCYDDRTHFGK